MTRQNNSQAQPSRSHPFVRFRLLPVLIGCAVILIGVKFERVYEASRNLFIHGAQASESQGGAKPESKSKTSTPKPTIPAKPEADKVKDKPVPESKTFNILDMSAQQIDVLRTLEKRHQQLVQRESTISEREAMLQVIEKRLDLKLANLSKIQQYLEGLLKNKDEKENESIKRLVGVYEKMKPADAANILQGIELETLLSIMEQMKEAKASAVLSKMEPLRARILTMELAQRRKKQEEQMQEDFADQAAKEKSKPTSVETQALAADKIE